MTTPTTPDKSAPEKGMELLPCPFCGGKAEFKDNGYVYKGAFIEGKSIGCYNPNCWMQPKTHPGDNFQAFKHNWNTRTPAQETGQQDGEKAEALLKEVRAFIKAMPVKIEDDHMVFADDANRLKRLLINVEAALSAEKNYVGEEILNPIILSQGQYYELLKLAGRAAPSSPREGVEGLKKIMRDKYCGELQVSCSHVGTVMDMTIDFLHAQGYLK